MPRRNNTRRGLERRKADARRGRKASAKPVDKREDTDTNEPNTDIDRLIGRWKDEEDQS